MIAQGRQPGWRRIDVAIGVMAIPYLLVLFVDVLGHSRVIATPAEFVSLAPLLGGFGILCAACGLVAARSAGVLSRRSAATALWFGVVGSILCIVQLLEVFGLA